MITFCNLSSEVIDFVLQLGTVFVGRLTYRCIHCTVIFSTMTNNQRCSIDVVLQLHVPYVRCSLIIVQQYPLYECEYPIAKHLSVIVGPSPRPLNLVILLLVNIHPIELDQMQNLKKKM